MLVLKEGAEVDADNPHERAVRARQCRWEGDEVHREVNVEKELKLLPDKFLVWAATACAAAMVSSAPCNAGTATL